MMGDDRFKKSVVWNSMSFIGILRYRSMAVVFLGS